MTKIEIDAGAAMFTPWAELKEGKMPTSGWYPMHGAVRDNPELLARIPDYNELSDEELMARILENVEIA